MKNKWFHFTIDRENVFALFCSLLMILLSAAMTLFHSELMNVVLRDICMILLLGFFLPIYYIVIVKRKSLSVLGVHKNKLTASLIINIIAGISLLGIFIGKNTETILLHIDSFYAITYIFAAGIFEMIFIYGFLRYEFERAFGILPAVWDVLVNSEAGSQIKDERSFIIAILLFLAMAGMSIYIYRKYKKAII